MESSRAKFCQIKPEIPEIQHHKLRRRRLVYFHRKEEYRGPLTMAPGYTVIICVEYNSRFARFRDRRLPGGKAEEQPMEPGQSVVCDGWECTSEYDTGSSGLCPTQENLPEGQEGGFAILLMY